MTLLFVGDVAALLVRLVLVASVLIGILEMVPLGTMSANRLMPLVVYEASCPVAMVLRRTMASSLPRRMSNRLGRLCGGRPAAVWSIVGWLKCGWTGTETSPRWLMLMDRCPPGEILGWIDSMTGSVTHGPRRLPVSWYVIWCSRSRAPRAGILSRMSSL